MILALGLAKTCVKVFSDFSVHIASAAFRVILSEEDAV